MLPFITLEEHFVSQAVYNSPIAAKLGMEKFPPAIPKLLSLGEERIKDMDEGQVALKIISHNPACLLDAETYQKANDQLFQAVKLYPSRFAGFAVIPMKDPVAASTELERCVKELGFVGALVPNHADGVFYDGPDYDLNVPIYIHPTNPADDSVSFYEGNYDVNLQLILSTFGWGWHADCGLHFLRLYSGGVFDRFKNLKIILGHNGELVPFLLERTNAVLNVMAPRDRTLKQVWDENIWVTPSGMFTLPPCYCLLKTTKIDRILYSVDYPFANISDGVEFIRELANSGLVTEEQFEMIAYRNAESLLNVKAQEE
ncbi:hypothetical protein BC943DRAFT_375951 [Umbelopsis sp. AD052]|nr:hypothetical protein BC943DRAFT_375951 [Umbelopsis sp. AD052]